TNPKTLDEAFSLARATETRFANLDIWEFLRSNPSTLGEDFFKARITEARFEIIVKENKEHIVEKKIDVILPLPLQGEFASPEVKGSLDADEDNGVYEGCCHGKGAMLAVPSLYMAIYTGWATPTSGDLGFPTDFRCW
ncbi:hypothetical protein Tco_1086701, partial [Tanacetum coccineum]